MAALLAEASHIVYVFPTVPIAAPEVGDLARTESFSAFNAAVLRHTMIGSFLDMPGIAIPSGFTSSGLPTSVLLSMKQHNDDALLAIAAYLESIGL